MKAGIISLAVLMFMTSSLHAQSYKMGLGIRFSSPDAAVNTSATFKYFLNEKTAIEAMLSFGDPYAVGVLWEKHHPLLSTGIDWYAGGGGYVGFSGDQRAGFQGVLGLDYKIPSLPINFSVDWKPELNLATAFFFEPAAVGLSARFTIK
jgi:hypothetical protein